MFKLKITDELGVSYNFVYNDLKSLKYCLSYWLKNLDETPLLNIEIDFE